MQTVNEAKVRKTFNIPKEVQLNNEDTEAQWECFCELHSGDGKED